MLAHAGACVVWAEALSIRREMKTGWSGWEDAQLEDQDHQDEGERSGLLSDNNQAPSMTQTANRPTTHVLFEDEDEDDEDDSKKSKKGANGHGNQGHENIEMKRMN
jgi:hypothetical protein